MSDAAVSLRFMLELPFVAISEFTHLLVSHTLRLTLGSCPVRAILATCLHRRMRLWHK